MSKEIDPVCGMEVDAGTAAQTTYHDRTYYFCSDKCLRTFQEEPERHEPPYTVTKHMAAPKFGSAGSGGLENELPPEMHDRP
jgi:YHS domain-containing protein